MRERIVQIEKAPGKPFDHGRFELVLEGSEGQPLPLAPASVRGQDQTAPAGRTNGNSVNSIPLGGNSLVQILPAKKRRRKPATKTVSADPLDLIICRGCNRHVMSDAEVCPHCDGDVAALTMAHEKSLRADRKAYRRLLKLMELN
jgi:hypothetical protein